MILESFSISVTVSNTITFNSKAQLFFMRFVPCFYSIAIA